MMVKFGQSQGLIIYWLNLKRNPTQYLSGRSTCGSLYKHCVLRQTQTTTRKYLFNHQFQNDTNEVDKMPKKEIYGRR